MGRRGRRLCRLRLLQATLLRLVVPLPRRSADQHACLVRIQRPLAHRLVGDQPIQGAEQLAHVVDRETGHRLEHAVRERGPPFFRLPTKDGDPGLVVGRGHVDDETTGEPTDQPLVQRLDLRWRAVAGENDLPIGGLERVGEPEQLRLHLAPVGQELDVVHQQQIHVEESLPVRLAVTGGDRGMKGLHELIEGEILDVEVGVDRAGRVAHAHEEVRLPQAGAGVDEQGVVHRARRFGHGLGRRDGQAIRRADHVGVEAVQRIQRDRHPATAPAASRFSTCSEIPRSVSKTPVPWSASPA